MLICSCTISQHASGRTRLPSDVETGRDLHCVEPQDLSKDFSSAEDAQKIVKLKAFSKFDNTTEALAAAAALVESKLSKGASATHALIAQSRWSMAFEIVPI